MRARSREIVSRSSNDSRSVGRGRLARGRTPPDCANEQCPAVRETPAAAAACRNVVPLARALKNRARTSADFGFRPTHDLLADHRVRSLWALVIALTG